MDAQQGAAQEATKQGSPLRQLWKLLRRNEPVRPRWWHFAPHAALALLLIPSEFFFVPIQGNGSESLRILSTVLPWALEQIVFPVSLIRALWRCHRLGWRQGAVWIGRPALLALAVLVIHSPLRRQGQRWDFEQRLPRCNAAVARILEQHPDPLGRSEGIRVLLSDGDRNLTQDGDVRLLGYPGGMEMIFMRRGGVDLYVIGQPPDDVGGHVRYGEHWYLSSRSGFIIDSMPLPLLVYFILKPRIQDAYSFVGSLFHL